MFAGEQSEDGTLPEMDRRAYRRRNAMRCLLGTMIAHEDFLERAMTHEEIVGTFHYPDIDTVELLQRMLDRSYIACWVIRGAKTDRGGNDQITICDAWGTTFFGRDWFRNDDHYRENNFRFFFAERPI